MAESSLTLPNDPEAEKAFFQGLAEVYKCSEQKARELFAETMKKFDQEGNRIQ
jgi:hypothetical protein